jgi:hypothetical protein
MILQVLPLLMVDNSVQRSDDLTTSARLAILPLCSRLVLLQYDEE